MKAACHRCLPWLPDPLRRHGTKKAACGPPFC
jgi:hypothetical protein